MIRVMAFTDPEDARIRMDAYVDYSNNDRLHSGLYYLTPREVFEGKMEERLAEGQKKLDTARMNRLQTARRADEPSTLFTDPCLSISG